MNAVGIDVSKASAQWLYCILSYDIFIITSFFYHVNSKKYKKDCNLYNTYGIICILNLF